MQFAYVLDCIHSDDVELSTDNERIEYFFRMYDEEYNDDYRKRLYPNEQDRIANYLKGLPSCCGMAYQNYNIVQIGKSWGYALDSERKQNEFCERWFNVLAFRLMQIRNKYMNY